MKIVQFTAENVKKLRAVEISPKGEIVTISGRNGQGKTSILDAIWWALAGTEHIQAQPIRKGENKARIRLDFGELVVERRFTEKSSTLFVESAEGARFQSPQKMLDALIGELSFDPLAFARKKPEDQFEDLRAVAKVDVDFEKLDRLNAGDYAKRTDVNRDAKARRTQADAITVAADLPDAPLDESTLLDQIQQAGEHNATIETRKARRQEVQNLANNKKADGVRLRERAAKLREEATEFDAQASAVLKEAADLEAKIDAADALPAPIDVAGIRAKLEHAKQVNAKLGARDRRRALEAEAEALEAEARKLTEAMAARDQAKADAIAAAQMPVPGLGLGAGVVTYNGIPFDQASDAEKLKVSLSIAMAANPKLRVIRIQDGSLLDAASLEQVQAMAKEGDYQVWIERVDDSGKLGVYIEDGAVVAVDGAAPPPPPAAKPEKKAKAAA